MTYFTSKKHLKTQFQRPYDHTSSFSVALRAKPLGGPEGFQVFLYGHRLYKKETVNILLWQH